MGYKVSLGLTGFAGFAPPGPGGKGLLCKEGALWRSPREFCALGGALSTKWAISRAPLCLHLKLFGAYFKKNFVS